MEIAKYILQKQLDMSYGENFMDMILNTNVKNVKRQVAHHFCKSINDDA